MQMTMQRQPVTPDDLRTTARLCVAALRPALKEDWSILAHGLEWSCRQTLDHISDALDYYATNMGAEPPQSPHGPYGERGDAPIADLLATVEPLADLVAEVASGLPPETRIPHMWGPTDPEGILAMGIVELLVHTRDIGQAMGIEIDDPAADRLAVRALGRLFPGSPEGPTPVGALLFATGRIALPNRPELTSWRWRCAPLTDR
jgi:hypothetical protein